MLSLDELRLRIEAQDASFAEIKRTRKDLLASADAVLATYQKIDAGYDRIIDFFQSKIDCGIRETVHCAEPLTQATEKMTSSMATTTTSPLKHKRSPRKSRDPMQSASRKTQFISPTRECMPLKVTFTRSVQRMFSQFSSDFIATVRRWKKMPAYVRVGISQLRYCILPCFSAPSSPEKKKKQSD
eukprot:TRINITY_DN110154_c0_g1_i1.p1 TRINITY_DN110154_c0_g1~~TRINITY_DN110154_c0_g1_i1.p1  ORF type:complete len:185 (+),score=7.70 TRINITY_DN110154_c0_g1_i1:33-587(+)